MRNIFSYILLFLLAVSCNRDYSVLDAGAGIDERLIGDWVTISQSTLPGTPSNHIKGIRILDSGEIQSLGVETSTGKIKSYFPPKRESYSILKARNNNIELEQHIFNPPISRLCFGHYSINDTVLYFEKDPDSQYFPIGGNFFKTTDGTKITKPIISEMTIQLDGELVENQKIYFYPSSYATDYVPYDSIEFQIISILDNNWKLIINLKNFMGAGRYSLDSLSSVSVRYLRRYGCLIEEYYTSDSDSGFIEINEFDIQEKVCSGTFEFTISNPEFTEEKIKCSNGEFRIPFYTSVNASITK